MTARRPQPTDRATPLADDLRFDVSGRPTRLRELDLDDFFHPRTIAVIGASATPGRPNTVMWQKVRAWGATNGAQVIPVHPSHTELDGAPCFASILDIPGEVDLAVILVGDAVDMFEIVLDKKPAFAVIFSAGFAEAGAAGEARQRRLDALIASGGTHLLGPNTNLNAFETFRDDLPAPKIALITQSGHQGRPVFQAQELGVALSHWAPTGNEADLEFADFARYFADQTEVGVIAAYIEGFKDGRTLVLAADHAARAGVPIVCVKVGRSEAGRSMARSHTGHLTGSDRVTDAVFRQFGITRAEGLDDLTDTAAMFARTAPPRAWKRRGARGPDAFGVCVYAISGGTGAHMADLLAAAGVALPPLAPRTQRALHELIPPYLRVSNPVDSGGPPSMDERGGAILQAIIDDPGIDVIVCPITGALESISRPLAQDLVAAAATTDKPIFVVWGSPDTSDAVYTDVLLPSGLPTFRTFHNCVAATRAYTEHWAFRARYSSPFAEVATAPSRAGRAVTRALAGATPGHPLSEHASKELLRSYGVPVSRDLVVSSPAEAARAAAALGYPVVMKVSSADVAHKSELGLVALDITSAAQARRTYHTLLERAAVAAPHAAIEGVLVGEQIRDGVETVVGVSSDELFGPTIVFGLGGVFVEVVDDVTFRVPPFDRAEAARMVREVRGHPLLAGARGAPPVDLDALVDVIMRVQRLAVEQAATIAELDINPLVVRRDGAIALDALVIPR